jgi:hypothetical protein
MALDIYNAINDTYGSLPATFKEASFTQDTFVTLAQRVTAFNRGVKCAVFGTQLALSKIVPTNEYFKMQLGAEYTKTGYLGRFMSTDLFEIPQKADWTSSTYDMKLDDTRLYFISAGVDKLVKVGIEGSTLSFTNNTFDNATLVQKQTIMKRWATALISGAHFAIMDLGA